MSGIINKSYCYCCVNYSGQQRTDFQKIAELKELGLTLYRYVIYPRSFRNVRSANTRTVDSNDIFILHNNKNKEISPVDYVSALDRNTIHCSRCRELARRAQRLLQYGETIVKKGVKGICEHCLALQAQQQLRRSCFECQEIVKKFVAKIAIDSAFDSSIERKKQSKAEFRKPLDLSRLHRDVDIEEMYQSKIKETGKDKREPTICEYDKLSIVKSTLEGSEIKFFDQVRYEDTPQLARKGSNLLETLSIMNDSSVVALVNHIKNEMKQLKEPKSVTKTLLTKTDEELEKLILKTIMSAERNSDLENHIHNLIEADNIANSHILELRKVSQNLNIQVKDADPKTEETKKAKYELEQKIMQDKGKIKEEAQHVALSILKELEVPQKEIPMDKITKKQKSLSSLVMKKLQRPKEIKSIDFESKENLPPILHKLSRQKLYPTKSGLTTPSLYEKKIDTSRAKQILKGPIKLKRPVAADKETYRKLHPGSQYTYDFFKESKTSLKPSTVRSSELIKAIKDREKEKRKSTTGTKSATDKQSKKGTIDKTHKTETTENIEPEKETTMTKEFTNKTKLAYKREGETKKEAAGTMKTTEQQLLIKTEVKLSHTPKDDIASAKISSRRAPKEETTGAKKSSTRKPRDEITSLKKPPKPLEKGEQLVSRPQKLKQSRTKDREVIKEKTKQKEDLSTKTDILEDDKSKERKENIAAIEKEHQEKEQREQELEKARQLEITKVSEKLKKNLEKKQEAKRLKEEKEEDKKTTKEEQEKEKGISDILVKNLNKVLLKQDKAEKKALRMKGHLERRELKFREKAQKKADKSSKPLSELPYIQDRPRYPVGPILKDTTGEEYIQLPFRSIRFKRPSIDDLILKLVKIRQSKNKYLKEEREGKTKGLIEAIIANKRRERKLSIGDSESELDSDYLLDIESLLADNVEEIGDAIVGTEILNPVEQAKYWNEKKIQENKQEPSIFRTTYEEPFLEVRTIEKDVVPTATAKPVKMVQTQPSATEQGTGIIRYKLSDQAFVDNGWTQLPTQTVLRKMNLYRMHPAHPEFDWFKHNSSKGYLLYDTGELLAVFDNKGHGRWYYRNGNIALDFYDAEELNANKRTVIYSSGEPQNGRQQPITVLGTFDYSGNGVILDHHGNIRLKYNQTEGALLDHKIGPESHWKWHDLNDPPKYQDVWIETREKFRDPKIHELVKIYESKDESDDLDVERTTIEFNNSVKEKIQAMKIGERFKPFPIRMKALKINDYFSLRVLDQANIYIKFKDGTTNLKLNIGMNLDPREIVDMDYRVVGPRFKSQLEKFPALSDSIDKLQGKIANARVVDHAYRRHEQWLRRKVPCDPMDHLFTAVLSRPVKSAPLPQLSTGCIKVDCNCN